MTDQHPNQGVNDANIIANLGMALLDARERHADEAELDDKAHHLLEEGLDLLRDTSDLLEDGTELVSDLLALLPSSGTFAAVLQKRGQRWIDTAVILVGEAEDDASEDDDPGDSDEGEDEPLDLADLDVEYDEDFGLMEAAAEFSRMEAVPDTDGMVAVFQPRRSSFAGRQRALQDDELRYRRIVDLTERGLIPKEQAADLLLPFLTPSACHA